jgi:predicted hydrocarbon binding protein
MTQEPPQDFLSDFFIHSFWQAAAQEMSVYSLNMILLMAGFDQFVEGENELPKPLQVSVSEFGLFQHALREYYGRGARGLLTRAGCGTWGIMAQNLPWQQALLKDLIPFLPFSFKTWLALNQLRALLSFPGSWTHVNRVGGDLYYLDYSSLGISEQNGREQTCWIMIGLIQGTLERVTNRVFEVEEVSCRRAGSEACKFRIHFIA